MRLRIQLINDFIVGREDVIESFTSKHIKNYSGRKLFGMLVEYILGLKIKEDDSFDEERDPKTII